MADDNEDEGRRARPKADDKSRGQGAKKAKRAEARRRKGDGARRRRADAAPRRSTKRDRSTSPRLMRRTTRTSVIPALMKEFSYKNPMQVPRSQKIVINMGLGEAVDEPEDHRRRGRGARARSPARSRSSRAPRSRSRPSSCARAMPIGAMVTLRRERMWEFLDRLVSVRAAARARLPGRLAEGASTAAATTRSGSRSRSSSPRSTTTRSTRSRGMNISFVTTARHRRRGARAPRSTSACRSGS